MRRLYRNLLVGASTITILPQTPVRNYIVSNKLPRLTKSDNSALAKDWQAVGNDLRAAIPADAQKPKR